jgi:hypothetical protein
MRQVIFSSKPADFDKWLTTDPEHLRILYYNKTISQEYHEYVIYKDDEKIALSVNVIKIKLSTTGKIFTRRISNSGYTYNLKTKKGKSWFGKPFFMSTEFIRGIKTYLNIDTDWINDLPYLGSDLISSNTVIAKILSGKITNCRDMVKEYLKYHHRGLKISPEKVYTYLKNTGIHNSVSLKILLSRAKYLTNPDHCLDHSIDYDLLTQARILNRKINAEWSSKRQAEIHHQWTQEIMEIELKYIEDEKVNYRGTLPELPGFQLIDSRKALFQVGTIEHHCVYTNYWGNVKDKHTFILYGEYKGTMYTCSIVYASYYRDKVGKFSIQQLYKAYNQLAPQELSEIIQLWLNKPEVQEFFRTNYAITPDRLLQEEVNVLPLPF